MPRPRHAAQRLINLLEGITTIIGTFTPWLTLLLILGICTVVIMRYFFGAGSIALQEATTYLHATIFMLGIAWTLKQGGHVRVDVFYRNASPQRQAWIDVAGGVLFLLPLCVLILWLSWDYVLSSWAIREKSNEGSGLPYVYLLKTLILILPATLLIQGVADILKNLLFALGLSNHHSATKVEPL
ncbi:MAG: hypothetical protein VR73_10455 [Gammaproteobacteria bacterium BRH_c0]|nr:MAG: hypothetical protein VR73_10455 [Gammaproteobacteria bacterium BRH_c0]